MTIKEITTLRKSGLLQEALEAAEDEFTNNSNRFTAGALFWCLNDLYKQQCGQDQYDTFERMRALYNDYGNGDSLMMSRFSSIEQRRKPQSQLVIAAIEKAKNNENIDSDYQQVSTWYSEGNLEADVYSDFGWLIYYTLKQTNLQNTQKKKHLLHQYLKLNLPRPSILHSLILGEAVKVKHNTPLQFRIRDFIKMWGLENLRDEDWEQYKIEDGKIVSSLVEKLISVYTKEIKTDNVSSPIEFHVLVDRALVKYPSNQYMPFYKAILLKSQGKMEDALNYFKQLILKTPLKCYLWNQASALLTDVDLKVALLCKAISVERDESFVGGARLNLAKALIEKGLVSNANYELNKYREFYAFKGWSLKQDYQDILSQIPEDTIPVDNLQLYDEYILKAEDFIYSALPSKFAIKLEDKQLEDKYHPGRKFEQWTIRTKDGIFRLKKPTKFGLNNRMKNGTPLDIKIHDKRIVWIKISEQNPLHQDWIKKLGGTIKIRIDKNKKQYAMLEGAYIGNRLLKGMVDGDTVKAIAIKQEDGRWTAISISKI